MDSSLMIWIPIDTILPGFVSGRGYYLGYGYVCCHIFPDFILLFSNSSWFLMIDHRQISPIRRVSRL